MDQNEINNRRWLTFKTNLKNDLKSSNSLIISHGLGFGLTITSLHLAYTKPHISIIRSIFAMTLKHVIDDTKNVVDNH